MLYVVCNISHISELCATGLRLKREHAYYHQVQGQIYFTGVDASDFVVWTQCGCTIVRVYKDASWAHNIDDLIQFYFNVFVPHIK